MPQHTPHHRPPSFESPLATRVCRLIVASGLLTGALAGCATNKATVSDLDYCDDVTGIKHYRGYETKVEYPCIDTQTAHAVAVSEQPHNILSRAEDESREMTLTDAIQVALSHNDVIETSALGGVGSKAVLTNPDAVASVYDPAIQRSGVLFGRGRGVEAALADFDTTFATSMTWGRDVSAQGVIAPRSSETGNFTSSLAKQFAYGGSIQLNNNWNYLATEALFPGGGGFPSAYSGTVGAAYRQPLLAGSGAEYTRIAGPANPQFGAITGVGQGVLIARITSDITIADFEVAVRNAMRDIENSYWDLYLTYRIYDTAVAAHQSAYQTWREAQDRLEVGILKPADELQTRDRLYETKANVETTLSNLFKAETELRRLIGLPMNDGTVLRPVDEPVLAEFIPDWRASVTDALTNRVELRRQKWSIKSTQLQLKAAKSLVRPRMDFVGSYNVNGFGDRLISQSERQYGNAVGSLTRDDLESWTAGVEFSMPIGFRQARSQVRNLELQLTKAMAVLASQEKNIAHDIAVSVQDVTAAYAAAQSNRKRLMAAARRVELLEAERDVGTLTLDLVLRAQASLAAAEGAYYEQLVSYSKAITAFQLATGGLLDHNGVYLAEGGWCQDAHCDAAVRAHARTHAKDAPHLESHPNEFVSPGPAGSVDLRMPYATDGYDIVPTLSDPEVDDADDVPERPAEPLEFKPQPPAKTPELLPPSTEAETAVRAATDSVPTTSSSRSVLDTLVPERLNIFDRKPTRAASTDSDFPSLIRR